MATTADGIVYPVASDFIAPLNTHLQTLAESTQAALDSKAPSTATSYTPTFDGLTIGNGVVSAKYSKVGNVIFDEISITLGSTSAVTGVIYVNGLQPALNSELYMPCGEVSMFGNGSLTFGRAVNATATRVSIWIMFTAGTNASWNNISANNPFTWGTGNKILIKLVRLAA